MRAALLPTLLLCGLLLGCDRAAPSAPIDTQAVAASQSAPLPLPLHDWVREPLVAESERGDTGLRVVSTAPSVTEICCALGLREQIVGRTRYCMYPPGIEAVPAIGALDETNGEYLIGLRPDLVLVSGASRAITERLERLGLRYEALPDRSLDDVFAAIRRAGELTGRPKTAEQLAAGLQDELTQVAQHFRDVPPARVLVVLGVLADPPAPPFVAGPGSFHDALLRRAGHHNVAEAWGQAYAPVSLEAIVRADPEVIVELDADGQGRTGGAAEACQVWAKLGALQAVHGRRVHVLVGQHQFIPGPRLARAFAELCQAIAEPTDD
ncbi:MAG: helical backbone metal receptor [Phycisphaerae bacterium]|jgi:iron complex transport system substrate-binding protein